MSMDQRLSELELEISEREEGNLRLGKPSQVEIEFDKFNIAYLLTSQQRKQFRNSVNELTDARFDWCDAGKALFAIKSALRAANGVYQAQQAGKKISKERLIPQDIHPVKDVLEITTVLPKRIDRYRGNRQLFKFYAALHSACNPFGSRPYDRLRKILYICKAV